MSFEGYEYARTLAELGEAAKEAGLAGHLDQPLQDFMASTGMRRWIQDAIDGVSEDLGFSTLGAMLQMGDDLFANAAGQPIRQALLHSARAYLRRAAKQQAEPNNSGDERPARTPKVANAVEWATERGVAGRLRLTMLQARQRRPGFFERMPAVVPLSLTLRDALSDDLRGYAGYLLKDPRFVAFRSQVWAFLEAEAEGVAQLEQEERRENLDGAELPHQLRDDAVLARLIARVRALRRVLRADLEPHPLAQETAEPLQLHDDFPPYLSLAHRRDAAGPYGPPLTQLRLEANELPLQVDCSCYTAHACAHRLAMVNRLLRLLLAPESSPLVDRLRHQLATPDWQRLLEGLERHASQAAEAPASSILWWALTQDPTGFHVLPFVQDQGKRGLLKPRRISFVRLLEERFEKLSAEDQEIARLASLSDAIAHDSYGRQSGAMQAIVLRKLVGHPRVVLDGSDPTPLTVRFSSASLVAHADAEGMRFLLGVGDRRYEPEDGLALVEQGWIDDLVVQIDEQARVVDLVPYDAKLWDALRLVERAGTVIPRSEQHQVTRRLPALSKIGPVAIEGDVERRQVAAERQIVIRLAALGGGGLEARVLIAPLAGGPLVVPGLGPHELVAASNARELTFLRRRLEDEPAWVAEELAELLPVDIGVERGWVFALSDLDRALELLAGLSDATAIRVEWTTPAWRVSRAATVQDLKLRISSRQDWFGLDGEAQVDDERVTIAALLQAARVGRRFVRVEGDRFVRLSQALSKDMAAIEAAVSWSKRGVEIRPLAVPAAAAALAAVPRLGKVPEAWKSLLERVARAQAIEPEPPPGLAGTLRPYQIDGFRWLARLATWGVGACLADDMGLGKTLQALAVLSWRRAGGPALVVTPTSVSFNWLRECERFAPELRPILYRGPERSQLLDTLGPGDLLVVSYPLLAKDAALFKARAFHTLVLDEAQAVKNTASRRAQAVREIEADWRVALTGTPIENHLSELYALFRAVEPGLFGSWEEFRDRWQVPIQLERSERHAAALAKLIQPFVLRRSKAQVARELPPRTEIQVDVALSAKERALYEDARLVAVAELSELEGVELDKGRFHVLAALTRLRQIACHPRLADPSSSVASSKLARVLELLASLVAEGQHALVFSQFTQHLALLKEALDAAGVAYAYMDGATPAAQRPALIDHFQSGAVPIFLISLKTGGMGLNLTAAENVLHLDPWWNPAVEDQASDRAHRIGQDKPVTVYRFVTRGTIEDAILSLHADKRDLASRVLDGTSAAASLDARALMSLLRQGALDALEPESEDEPSES